MSDVNYMTRADLKKLCVDLYNKDNLFASILASLKWQEGGAYTNTLIIKDCVLYINQNWWVMVESTITEEIIKHELGNLVRSDSNWLNSTTMLSYQAWCEAVDKHK